MKAAQGCIYLLTCTLTGKVYVGQTTQYLAARWDVHRRAARNGVTTHLANAIRKYGPESFQKQVLETCIRSELNERERYWIAHLRANDRKVGYNMSAGGDGGQNVLSPEVRAKISRTKTGVRTGPLSEERKRKISRANTGKRRTAEQKARIRASRTYGPLSPEHRLRISQGLRRSARFKLSSDERATLVARLPHETDAELAKAFEVSRKMVWRLRHTTKEVRT
jgi:group I intron endonuclease